MTLKKIKKIKLNFCLNMCVDYLFVFFNMKTPYAFLKLFKIIL
jgi:hypothetical protein